MNAPASNVNLPASVKAQVDAANKMIAELNAPPASAPAPAHVPASAAPAPPPPPAAAATTVEDRLRASEARYAALRGKYDSETALMREQITQTNQLVGQLLEKANTPPPAPPAAPQTPQDFLKSLGATDEDLKDYGELLPIVVRLAQNMYKPTVEKLENELRTLRNSTASQAAASVEDRRQAIFTELDKIVPAWKQINENAHFLDWLKVVDVFSGVSRHVALSAAFKNLDRARVVAIFEAYAREYPEQARAPGAPPVDPATLVAPEIRGDQPPAAPEGSGSKRIYSEQEIRTFYARVRKKQVSKEDYDRFQKEIAAATAEGRVRPERPDFHANAR